MSELPRRERARRERVHACIHPYTYKYFFPRERVFEVWSLLQQRYGALRKKEAFRTQEIDTPSLLFRSTWLGNPITVYRKPHCSERDVEEFHALVGFDASLDALTGASFDA
jgi:hypothetical protein